MKKWMLLAFFIGSPGFAVDSAASVATVSEKQLNVSTALDSFFPSAPSRSFLAQGRNRCALSIKRYKETKRIRFTVYSQEKQIDSFVVPEVITLEKNMNEAIVQGPGNGMYLYLDFFQNENSMTLVNRANFFDEGTDFVESVSFKVFERKLTLIKEKQFVHLEFMYESAGNKTGLYKCIFASEALARISKR